MNLQTEVRLAEFTRLKVSVQLADLTSWQTWPIYFLFMLEFYLSVLWIFRLDCDWLIFDVWLDCYWSVLFSKSKALNVIGGIVLDVRLQCNQLNYKSGDFSVISWLNPVIQHVWVRETLHFLRSKFIFGAQTKWYASTFIYRARSSVCFYLCIYV